MAGNKKNISGRPSEYKGEYVEKVDEYLALNQDEELQAVKQWSDGGNALYENRLKVKLPTIEGFALFLGVSKKSLLNWEKEHNDFLHALDKIRTEQHNRLINSGLSGSYNSTIAKLILSSNHGMSEKTSSEVTGKDGKDLFPEMTKEKKKKLDSLLNK
jgi:hypothetical protein